MGKNAKKKKADDTENGKIESTTKASDKKAKIDQNEEHPPQSSIPDTADIDDLFGQLKNKKKQQQQEEEQNKKDLNKNNIKDSDKDTVPAGNKFKGSKDDLFGTGDRKSRKRTEEGYRVYTEDELQFGRKGGGGTALCPFDCDCCF